MYKHLLRLAAAAAVLAAAAATVPAVAAAAAAPAAARSAERPAAAARGSSLSRTVLLVNGDSVSVPAGGAAPGVSAVSAPGGGPSGSVLSLGLAGKAYRIPAAALPYLGHGLDPSLFEVSALLGAETAGRLPVRVGYAGTVPAMPGVTITGSGGGVASGYLTAASAARFGAALARQYLADRVRGRYGQDGIFGHGVTISLAGTTPARAAVRRAAYSLHTLTVRGTDQAGRADTGDVAMVFNADNSSLFDDPVESVNEFYQGTAKFSVPAGHYWALGDFTDLSGSGSVTAERLTVLPQFTVAGDTSVRLAEQAATSKVTMVTPRPSAVEDTEFDLRRPSATGRAVTAAWLEAGAVPLWVSPTSTRPTVGGLQTFTDQWRASPAGLASPYEYDLAYQDLSGIIPRQRYLVRPRSLAVIDMRYYSDQPASQGWVHPSGVFRAQFNDLLSEPSIPVAIPGRVTEYLTGGPSLIWTNYIYATWVSRADNSGFVGDTLRVLHAGERMTEDWNAYPLHPTADVVLLGKAGLPAGADPYYLTMPSADRAGNTLRLQVNPFSDSQPGHRGVGFFPESGDTVTGSYQIDENGKKIAGGSALAVAQGTEFATSVTLSPKASVIRFELSAARTGAGFPLSTSSRTIWTWRSGHEEKARLPAGWTCWTWLTPPPTSRDCRAEPMMTLSYHVAGMALSGTAPSGRQVLRMTAGRLQLARAARITGATVQVSYDDGATWHSATVSGHAGNYTAVYTASPGSYVTLRVSAADAAGSRVAETITRAYQIAPAAATPAVRAACPAVPAGHARCLVEFVTRPGASQRRPAARAALATAQPSGWGAKTIAAAYRLPVSRGHGQTVALVEAYNTPHLAAYLKAYRAQYGLPPCTAASGCLRQVNQAGNAAPLPASALNTGWDMETTLDVDMVSAACPRCKILVVEGDSAAYADLAAAEDTAARLGAQAISNSYGVRENGAALAYAKAYDHPGHAIVASSGDQGFTAASFPADLATVTAVGGTELDRADSSRGWRETAWNDSGGSGSGCSAYVAKPAWQHDHDHDCAMRTVADVSALAWNVAVYEPDYGGWLTVGGTSAAAPLIAGVYALAGNAATIRPGYEYTHSRALFDVTTGNNNVLGTGGGAVCDHTYLCVAGKGYDAPTGLGTPDGTGAF